MEYNSFYGGRRGASFIIAKSYRLIRATEEALKNYDGDIKKDMEANPERYPDINSWIENNVMITAFSHGGQYKTVNYDEYVIIDTFNKNDIDNGKIYRRGYDYTNDWGGAEYIGQIVGPAGLGPHAEVIEKSEVNQKYLDAYKQGDKLDYRYGKGTLDTETNDLVPGAKGEVNNRTFDDTTDKIHWEYFSLRDEHQLESTCYIGFQTPYTVFDFFTTAVDPYNDEGNYDDMTAAIRQPISDEHPFYEQWEIHIPKGVKGDLLKNFRLYTPTEDETLPDFGGVEHTLGAGRTVLIYDYWWYDNKQNGEMKTLYLGEYEVIDDILIADDGTVTVIYKSNREDTVFNKRIQWIDKVTLTPHGDFTVDFNNGAESYKTHLVWVRNLHLAHDGYVTVEFNDLTTEQLNERINWVDAIDMDENGVVTTTWNNGDTDDWTNRINWINKMELEDGGDFFVTYNDDKGPVYLNTIQWVTGSTYDANVGTITFHYNTGKSDTYTYEYIEKVELKETGEFTVTANNGRIYLETEIVYPKYIDFSNGHTLIITGNDKETEFLREELVWVEDITIENDKFKLHYNNDTTQVLDLLLNQIDETVVPESGDLAYHLLVYYSAVEKRGTIEYNGKTGWVDLGKVKDYNGILIGTNIDSTNSPELDDPLNALEYLNATYPGGVKEGYTVGKVVTIGPTNDDKRLYAYDYDNSTWFYLGNPSGVQDIRSVILGKIDDADTIAAAQLMPTGSLWFVLEGDE